MTHLVMQSLKRDALGRKSSTKLPSSLVILLSSSAILVRQYSLAIYSSKEPRLAHTETLRPQCNRSSKGAFCSVLVLSSLNLSLLFTSNVTPPSLLKWSTAPIEVLSKKQRKLGSLESGLSMTITTKMQKLEESGMAETLDKKKANKERENNQ